MSNNLICNEIMKKLLFYSIILLGGCSAGQNMDDITPGLNVQQLVFTNLPDSIAVETSASFNFKIDNNSLSDYFEVSIDTIIPEYKFQYIDWSKVPVGVSQIPEEAIINVCRRGVELTINGNALEEDIMIQSGNDNLMSFTKPLVVGDYRIIFNIKDEKGRIIKKDIILKAYSPPVEIMIFDVDPWLDLGIYDKNFYEILNTKYTYEPLSTPFVNKQVDTVYSYECPMPGHPGEFTYPGIGLTVYVGQTNAREFIYQNDDRELSISWGTNWDNDIKHSAKTFPQKSGFHCLELTAWEHAKPGSFPLVLKFTDFWGKETQKVLILNAIPYN